MSDSLADLVTDSVIGGGLLPLSVTATVTIPGGDAVEGINACWEVIELFDTPAGSMLQRTEPLRTLWLRRADVAQVPRGTIIEAPEKSGGTVQRWHVDKVEQMSATAIQVVVVPRS